MNKQIKILMLTLLILFIGTVFSFQTISASEVNTYSVEDKNDLEYYLFSIFNGNEGYSVVKHGDDVTLQFKKDSEDWYKNKSYDLIKHYLNINEMALCKTTKTEIPINTRTTTKTYKFDRAYRYYIDMYTKNGTKRADVEIGVEVYSVIKYDSTHIISCTQPQVSFAFGATGGYLTEISANRSIYTKSVSFNVSTRPGVNMNISGANINFTAKNKIVITDTFKI